MTDPSPSDPLPLLPAEVSLSVNHPPHYTSHPSGIECITITEHMGFNIGNAIKYLWRADLKNNATEDLQKAAWYIARELGRRERRNAIGEARADNATLPKPPTQ